MKTHFIRNLIIGFSIIIIMIVVNALHTLDTIEHLSEETTNLYKHPYQISNTVRDINANLISMHRYMKDVALSKNDTEIQKALHNVAQNESIIMALLPILQDKYLGQKKEIRKFIQDFQKWKDIRQQVVLLTQKNEDDKAFRITQSKGAEHLKLIMRDLETLTKFADKKGQFFFQNTLDTKQFTIKSTIALSLLVIIISLLIALYIIRDTKRKEEKLKRYFHMIDHNILSLVFDTNNKIVESSHALCLFLKLEKEELHTKDIGFIVHNNENFKDMLLNLHNGFIWERELCFADGVYFHIRVEPSLKTENSHTLYSMILHDISDKKRIENISYTDQLTTLHNRRYFDKIARQEIASLSRTKQNATFVMIDIDFFKLYNDHYGHPQGDIALKAVANVLKQKLHRPHDYVFRIGGEEFVLLFNADSFEELREYLQDIILSVENLKLEHELSTASDYLTISAGAIYIENTKTADLDVIYKIADELLYEAKHSGRNQLKIDVL